MTFKKAFGNTSCKLCSPERIEIIKHSFNPECRTINSRLQINGACHHLSPFHMLQLKTISGADDREKREKVSIEESPRPACRQRRIEEEEDLGGNELDWIYSQPGTDSTELILDHFDSSTNDIHLV
jgi:hypothetical protein